MKFKNLFAITLSAVLVSQAVAGNRTVRVGTEPSFAPFEFMDENSKELSGFDIDIINAIGKAGGFTVEMHTMPFDGLIPAILTGSLDAGISGFTITDERKKRVAFSEPYCAAGLGVIVRKELEKEIKSVDDLKGHKICGQIGTSGAFYASSQVKDATVTQFNSAPEALLELDKKGCDAHINDRPVLEYYMAKTNNKNLVLLPDLITADQYGIVINKNDQELIDMINKGFSQIKSDGTYKEIYQKWFGSSK